MAIEQWRKPLPQMRQEAIGALAGLASGRLQREAPLCEMAARVTVAAHQVPALVQAGVFRPGDLDRDALLAMAMVVEVAAAWDAEGQDVADYAASLPEPRLRCLADASRPWARAVWQGMVPLSAAEKALLLWTPSN